MAEVPLKRLAAAIPQADQAALPDRDTADHARTRLHEGAQEGDGSESRSADIAAAKGFIGALGACRDSSPGSNPGPDHANAEGGKEDTGPSSGAGRLTISLTPKDLKNFKITRTVKAPTAGRALDGSSMLRTTPADHADGSGARQMDQSVATNSPSNLSGLIGDLDFDNEQISLSPAPARPGAEGSPAIEARKTAARANPMLDQKAPSADRPATAVERQPGSDRAIARDGSVGPQGQGSEARGAGVPAGPIGRAAVAVLSINRVFPGQMSVRRRFDEEDLQNLAESIKSSGMLEPILVRPHPSRANDFEVVAGERRFRAARRARLANIPAIIRDLSDRESLKLGLVENVQRQDLTAIEQAEGYQRLIAEFDYTQESLARALCKSRSNVSNMLRLLNLPVAIREMLQRGEITAGHGRALLSAEKPEELATKIVGAGLSVRQVEAIVQRGDAGRSSAGPLKPVKNPEILALERRLAHLLDLRVSISPKGQGGTLTIHYTSPTQLEDVLRRLSPNIPDQVRATSPSDTPRDHQGAAALSLPI